MLKYKPNHRLPLNGADNLQDIAAELTISSDGRLIAQKYGLRRMFLFYR